MIWERGRERPATEPSKCRSCGADVLWAQWASGKRMPVDSEPDMRPPPRGGALVLTHRKSADVLLVVKFEPAIHGSSRNRYTSHFATCPNADEHRMPRDTAASVGDAPHDPERDAWP